MEICTFDKCILASMDILTKEGKLQCSSVLMGVELMFCRISQRYHCMRSLSVISGLRQTCRIAQRGLRWSAPVCGSWVTAPIHVTKLRCIREICRNACIVCDAALMHFHCFSESGIRTYWATLLFPRCPLETRWQMLDGTCNHCLHGSWHFLLRCTCM